MIEFDDKVVALWFLSTIENHQDWLAVVREIEPDVKYELVYRFRYYDGDQSKNPFDDGDKKNWYKGTLDGTRAYVLASLCMVAKELEDKADGTLYEMVNDKGIEDFGRRFRDMPFTWARAE